MPPQVVASPISAASAIALTGRRATRNAAAAGPISSAVDRIAPTVIAESATASASATEWVSATARTRMPWARARSAESVLTSSGRWMTALARSAAPATASARGTMPAGIANIEPKSTVTAAPLTLRTVASKYSSSAARPNPAPSTTPVSRSRSRALRTSAHSMTPAAAAAMARNPSSGFTPIR